jgi:hypothetical protein
VAPGVVIVVAAWMLDPATCAGMAFGAPRVTVLALVELHQLLIERGFRRSSLGDPIQCLDRRIGERPRLVAEIAAWEEQRNAAGARVKWMFTTERARAKLARTYPDTTKEA